MLGSQLPNLLKALKEPPIFGPRTGQPECVRVCLQDARGPESECLYSSTKQKARKLGMHSFPSLLSYQGCLCPLHLIPALEVKLELAWLWSCRNHFREACHPCLFLFWVSSNSEMLWTHFSSLSQHMVPLKESLLRSTKVNNWFL
jgi:hypothetical protein